MATTVDEVDQALGRWEARLARVDENLLALEAEPTYQLLAGLAGRRAELDGVTRAEVCPALEAMSRLFDQRARLGDVIERAKTLRRSISTVAFWNTDRRVAEIVALLAQPSIQLPAIATPLAERDLLGASERIVRVAPEELLASMVRAFEAARDVVMAVAEVWRSVRPAIDGTERELDELARRAAALGETRSLHGELAALRAEVARLRAGVARDPLGVGDSLGGLLAPRVAAIALRLDELAAVRARIDETLTRARELEHRLGEIHRAALRGCDQARRAIVEAAGLPAPLDDAEVDGLAPWLEKLVATIAVGHLASAQVGLERWIESAERYVERERMAVRAVEALLARRDELAGRLSARRAQAAALAARGTTLDAEAEARARAAEALLRRRPAPLDEAAAEVAAYEAAVIALAH